MVSLILCLLFLFAVNTVLGFYFAKHPLPVTLGSVQLPPNTTVRYNTAEFNYTVKTNSLGFRGEEMSTFKPTDTFRILALGDSFTFGWGISEKETWPRILENYYKGKLKNKRVEVYNLGRPGDSPVHYLERVREYGEKLNADLIIVGVLEGDDPSQLVEVPSPLSADSETIRIARQNAIERIKTNNSRRDKYYVVFRRTLPNLYQLLMHHTSFSVNYNWINEVQMVLFYADKQGLERYSRIDPIVRKLFTSGKLNSSLLWLVLYSPTRYEDILDLNNSTVIDAQTKLTDIFREMKTVTEKNGQSLLIADIPQNLYVSSQYRDYRNKMGFNFSDKVWQSTASSVLIQKAAGIAEVEILPTLDSFRLYCSTDCFFPYDGHLNSKGSAFLAGLIEEKIAKLIPE